MSMWSETTTRAGGVAILCNPYLVTDLRPAFQASWSGNFIAATCKVADQKCLLLNVYAPTVPQDREQFFQDLGAIVTCGDDPVILGGDFNCTQLPAHDRSYSSRASVHVSEALDRVLRTWGLSDALDPVIDHDASRTELDEFHARHHTYQYTVGTERRSSRLDRWYVSANVRAWVAAVDTLQLGGPTDHSAVRMQLVDPLQPRLGRGLPRLYPPRRCAEASVKALSTRAIQDITDVVDNLDTNGATAGQYCHAWDSFKRLLVTQIESATKEALAKTTGSLKVAVTRLRRDIRHLRVEGDTRRVREAESELKILVTRWTLAKRRRLASTHTWAGRSDSRAFFSRVTDRRQAPIPALAATAGAPPRAISDSANRMRDAWVSTLQEPAGLERPRLPALGPRLSTTQASTMGGDLDLSEVQVAIRRCGRTKSGGPDRLPNAWYRDCADQLAPVLLRIYSVFLKHGVVPDSFGEATIVFLPKAGTTADPMKYRPIALLNTDYKVFARVLAARVKAVLPSLVITSQGGFVPGRNIHDVIDFYAAAQAVARNRNLPMLAVLLDIKKAYDSVNRPFLLQCLRDRGFPPAYVNIVAAFHTNTTGRMHVNGRLSDPVEITRGIRQGCPLAPQLFILAIDPLYRLIEADPELADPCPEVPNTLVPVAGFAGDTAVYLQSETRLHTLVKLLHEFATASGLEVHPDKCLVIRLCGRVGPITVESPFRHLALDESCRYLVILVGTLVSAGKVWELTRSQIAVRLRIATCKTHPVAQRARIAHAIAVPKILFVARHHWPTHTLCVDLDRRISRFVWGGAFGDTDDPRVGVQRHWASKPVARLPLHEGGLGLPCIRTELVGLATTVVAAWAYSAQNGKTKLYKAAGWVTTDVIQTRTRLRDPGREAQYGKTVWATGCNALAALYGTTIPASTQVLIQNEATAVQAQDLQWHWDRGAYCRDYTAFYRIGGMELEHRRRQDHGDCQVAWLPYLQLDTNGSGLLSDGSLVTSKQFKHLGTGQYIQDFIEWQ